MQTARAEAPSLPAADTSGARLWLRSDSAALAAMFAAVAVYYLLPGLLAAVLGGALFFALALWKPHLTTAPIVASVSLFYRPRAIGHYLFPLAEFLILASVAAWLLRDAYDLTRARRLAELPAIALAALRRPFAWAAIGFLIVGALSLVLPHPTHRAEALRELRWTIIEPVLFFALALRYIRTEADIFRTLVAYLVPSALNAQVGVDQYLFGDTWSMEGVGRAIGLYPGATAFGIFVGRGLAIAAALAVFLPNDERMRRWRLAFALLCIPLGLGVLFSFTRGAWVGVFVAIVVIAGISGARRLFLGLLGVAALGVPVGLFLLRGIERFSLTGSSNLSRFAIWVPALRVIRDHPFTGIGLDQFLYQDPAYGIPNTRFQTVAHPHNWVLDTWLRLGIWGLLLMIATFIAFFIGGLRAYRGRRGTVLGALTLALIAGMADHVAHGFVDMAYFTQDLAMTFWMLLALMGAILLLGPARPSAAAAGAEQA
jgi:putative inorganic carbon (hco3(-)) transporter